MLTNYMTIIYVCAASVILCSCNILTCLSVFGKSAHFSASIKKTYWVQEKETRGQRLRGLQLCVKEGLLNELHCK